MSLTKIGSIGINTGISFAGVTTIATLNASDNVLSVGGTVNFVSDVSIGGTVSIAGTLTYEDVTNVDAVGLITARDGIVVGSGITLSADGHSFHTGVVTATTFSGAFSGDGSALTGVANTDVIFTDKITLPDSAAGSINVGLGSDIQIFHDGSDSHIHNSTSNLRVRSNDIQLRDNAENFYVDCNNGGSVDLYHNGTKKLETASGGVTVTGTVAATSYTGSGAALTGISAGVLAMNLRLDGNRASYNPEVSGNGFTSGTELSNLTISMTPTNATTIFLITGNIYVTHSPSFMGKGYVTTQISGGSEEMIAGNGDTSHRATFPISDGDAGTGWTGTGKNFTLFYDHNTTSAVTFRVRVATTNASYPVYYNRGQDGATNDNDGCGMLSQFMIQEIDSSIFTGTDATNVYRGT